MCEMEEHSQTGSHRLCRWRDIRAIFADEYQNLVVPRATAPQRQVKSHTIELCPQHKVANESCTVASEPARHSVFALAIHSRLRQFLAGSLVAFVADLSTRSRARWARACHFSQRKPRNVAAFTQCLCTRSLGQRVAEVTVIAADASSPALAAFETFPTG